MADEETYENGIQDANIQILWTQVNDLKKDIKEDFKTLFAKIDGHTEQIVEVRTQFKSARFWALVIGGIVSFFVATGVSVAAIFFK